MKAVPTVHAILVSFRDADAVIACTESLRASDYPDLRVIVVDNASEEATVATIRTRAPDCRLIVNATNEGFGRGCNLGIDAARADGAEFLLLVNQDTTVAPDLVRRLVEWMNERPRAGAVAPKTLSSTRAEDGSPRRLYAGAWRTRLPLIQNIPGIERTDTESPDRPVRTDYAWGHGVLLRTSALEEVGAFDPAFFMYCEDIDLCRRLGAAGYEIWCEPRAVMWHDVADGARADHSEYWRWQCKVRSNTIFHRKHYGRGRAAVLDLLTVLVESKRLAQRRRFRAARHLLQAYGAGLVGSPSGDR